VLLVTQVIVAKKKIKLHFQVVFYPEIDIYDLLLVTEDFKRERTYGMEV